MKKLLLIITLILPLLLSSESWAIEYYDLIEREGLKYAPFTDVPFTGKTEGQIQASFKDGKLHGKWVMYYENGQLWIKENYVNGERHGESVQYHENGQLKSKENYVNGKKVD
jgi:antitoxin component YwqK of YwqJK toxin-antitoxin module